MSNICSNELHITCAKEDIPIIKDYIKNTFSNSDCYNEDINGDESCVEFYFDSKWNFPEELMNKMMKKLTKPDLFFGTCLSVEWGNLYCAFHSGYEDSWHYER